MHNGVVGLGIARRENGDGARDEVEDGEPGGFYESKTCTMLSPPTTWLKTPGLFRPCPRKWPKTKSVNILNSTTDPKNRTHDHDNNRHKHLKYSKHQQAITGFINDRFIVIFRPVPRILLASVFEHDLFLPGIVGVLVAGEGRSRAEFSFAVVGTHGWKWKRFCAGKSLSTRDGCYGDAL